MSKQKQKRKEGKVLKTEKRANRSESRNQASEDADDDVSGIRVGASFNFSLSVFV